MSMQEKRQQDERPTATENKQQHDKRHLIFRVLPCPNYDVIGIETWLSDMAKEGLFLAEQGISFGMARFTKGTPKGLLYRLQAAENGTSILSDDGGEPTPESLEITETFGWDYIANCGQFFVYRSQKEGVRELNTDPDVQALALQSVRKRQRSTLIPWACLYPLIRLLPAFVGVVITVGTLPSLVIALTFLGMWIANIIEWNALRKFSRALQQEGLVSTTTRKKASVSWRTHGRRNALLRVGGVLWWMLFCWCLGSVLFSAANEEKQQQPITDHLADMPFVTLTDFAQGDIVTLEPWALGDDYNVSRTWSDWLAPYNVDWAEHLNLTTADGTTLDGGLYIDYHELATPWLARQLAKEYTRSDKKYGDPSTGEVPDAQLLGVDYLSTWASIVGDDTAVLQKGNVVVHVQFVQFSNTEPTLTLAQWLAICANKM